MADHFADRLTEAVQAKGAPAVVGIDPVYSKLPVQIRERKELNDEMDVEAAIDAIFEFCTKVLRIVSPLVPAVKFNSAFFERYYWEGVEAYYSLIFGIEVASSRSFSTVKSMNHSTRGLISFVLKALSRLKVKFGNARKKPSIPGFQPERLNSSPAGFLF